MKSARGFCIIPLMKSRFFSVRAFILALVVFVAMGDSKATQCRSIHSDKSILSEIIANGKKVSPKGSAISLQEFESVLKGLLAEKLVWFSIKDFAQAQIDRWEPEATVKNFLSYTVSVIVKKSNGEAVEVILPLVSYDDTRSGGYSWHIHLWRYFKENYLSAEQATFVDKGAVIIEKQGDDFIVEDSHAYPHIENYEGRKVIGAELKNSVIFKKYVKKN